MKNLTVTKEFTFLQEYYRVTRSVGPEIIKIEKMVPNGFWGKNQMIYKTIYHGHIVPLEESLRFFKESVVQ